MFCYSMSKMDGNGEEENVITEICESNKIVNVNDLSDFVYKRTLNSNSNTKTVVLEGRFCHDKETAALLILEKDAFSDEDLKNIFKEEKEIEKSFQNDIYHSYRYSPKTTFNGIKATLIYPATEKHIQKYEFQPVHIIEETPELYETVTLPFLKSEQFSLDWVYNILEHKSETDRIIFEDPDPEVGFVLVPDLKWNGSVETLYLLALPFKRGIMSLRDLTQKELPLLRNIYNKGVKAIKDKYSLPSSRLRVYLHYQPSFYHLHVHFTFLQNAIPGSGAERAHLITTVINNLQLMSNYYRSSTLDFTVRESDNLFSKYEALSLVKRAPVK